MWFKGGFHWGSKNVALAGSKLFRHLVPITTMTKTLDLTSFSRHDQTNQTICHDFVYILLTKFYRNDERLEEFLYNCRGWRTYMSLSWIRWSLWCSDLLVGQLIGARPGRWFVFHRPPSVVWTCNWTEHSPPPCNSRFLPAAIRLSRPRTDRRH